MVLVCALFITGCRGAAPAPVLHHASTRPGVVQWAAPATQATGAQLRLWQDVHYLASDRLEGRGIRTHGIDLAAEYLAAQYQSAGLVPAPGYHDFFQRFDYVMADQLSAATALGAAGAHYQLYRDFTAPSFSAAGSFTAPVAFAGYGITDTTHDYDDYADLDVRGKVVLIMRFEPHDDSGQSRFVRGSWSLGARLSSKVTNAAQHGAVAVLIVNPPRYHGMDVLMPFAVSFIGQPSAIPVLNIRQDVANQLLARSRLPELSRLQDQIDSTARPASRPMPGVTVEGTVAIAHTTYHLRNVMAVVPGRGMHADQYIVVGAHYDHLGYGGPGSLAFAQHAIHPGADDNASGAATIVEIARTLARGPAPARSILFINFTAEESGVIGSRYFVDHPPVALDRIAAMLNLDMVGRLQADNLVVGGAGTAKPFDSLVATAAARTHLSFSQWGRDGIAPSDNATFASCHIPVLFLFTGMHADYHTPTDTADKINYAGMVRVTDFALSLVRGMARMPRPQFIAMPNIDFGLPPPSAPTTRTDPSQQPD